MWFDAPAGDVALCRAGHTLTYGALADQVGRVVARLRGHDGVVAVRARNEIASVVSLLAVIEAGLPLALLPDGTPTELAAYRGTLGAAVEIDNDGEVVWRSTGVPKLQHPEAALIAFTSGSSGQPRAVQISRTHLDANTRNCIEMTGMCEIRAQSLFAPISHLFATFGHLLPGLRAGIRTELYGGVAEVRGPLARGEIEGIVSGVPAHWEALLRFTAADRTATHKISRLVSSGAPLSAALRRRLADRFDAAVLLNGYGLTESPRVLALSSLHPRFFSDVTGLPTPGAELDITPDGELRVRGDLVMLGYLGAAGATAQRMRDGWFHTGDAARCDNGLFTVLGRRDDVRKVGGEIVSLVEVDQELMLLHGVEDAASAVVPDDLYGEIVVAFLVGDVQQSRVKLRDALAQRIAWRKLPTRFLRVDQLPRNRAGKIQRGQLLTLITSADEL